MTAEYMAAAFDAGTRLGLTQNTKAVLAILGDHADEGGKCWPSAAWIGHRIGIHENSVHRCLKTLVEHGLISRERPNRHTSSTTTINIEAILGHKEAHRSAWKEAKDMERVRSPKAEGTNSSVRSRPNSSVRSDLTDVLSPDLTDVFGKPLVDSSVDSSEEPIRSTPKDDQRGAPSPADTTNGRTRLRVIQGTTPAKGHPQDCWRCSGTGWVKSMDQIGTPIDKRCGEAA